jgi:hypothetical protein
MAYFGLFIIVLKREREREIEIEFDRHTVDCIPCSGVGYRPFDRSLDLMRRAQRALRRVLWLRYPNVARRQVDFIRSALGASAR